MSLSDFLIAENKRQENKELKEREQREKKALEKEAFEKGYNDIFERIISPAIDKIVQIFRDNNLTANRGQEVRKGSWLGEKQSSLTIHFKGRLIQFDIITNSITREIDIYRTVSVQGTPPANINIANQPKTKSYKLDEIDYDTIESLIQDGLNNIK